MRISLFFPLLVSPVFSETKLFEKKDGIYALQPKLRIKGQELASDPSLYQLKFMPKLVPENGYNLSIIETALILELRDAEEWAAIEENGDPVPLFLTEATYNGKNILKDGGIQVAMILPTPDITESSELIYTTTPPYLILKGKNFNLKHTALFFDPPLIDGEDMSIIVTDADKIQLTKKHGKMWRKEPGPLSVVAMDTGGGRLPLDAEKGGRLIAEVQADLEGHGVSVVTNIDKKVYQSTEELKIEGSGFRTAEKGQNKLRFANNLIGGGTNYTISSVTADSLTLTLTKGSKWKIRVDHLPSPLNILAIDAGDGFVALGPSAAKSGRNIAMVYEDPTLVKSDKKIYRTHTHTLGVEGTGFNFDFSPIFDFEKDILIARKDYYVNVLNRTNADIILATNAWMDSAGDLKVLSVDTGAGKVTFPDAIKIASVVDDEEEHKSGVSVQTNNNFVVYQSDSKTPIIINGSKFKGIPKIVFKPPLQVDIDYKLSVLSEEQISLSLMEGKKWSPSSGPLLITSIDVSGEMIDLGGGHGIKVATILSDPTVKEENLRIYATMSKHFTIQGSGFINSFNPDHEPKVKFDTIPESLFTVSSDWTDSFMKVWLVEGKEWAHLEGEQTAAIKVVSIDTGGGEVMMPNGGTMIVTVHADSDSTLCDDSCTYANDGQCDEPSQDTGGVLGLNLGYSDDSYNIANSYSNMSSYAGVFGSSWYGSDDLGFGIAACDPGTDCTDCGLKITEDGECTNTCLRTARDGVCDDPRVGGTCALGTDCQDCGPVGKSNYSTNIQGSGFDTSSAYLSTSWYDDDSAFLMDDDWVLQSQIANSVPMYKRNFKDHESIHREREGSGYIFMDVLWAVVMLVGGTVLLGFCLIAYRRFKTGQPNFIPLPVSAEEAQEFELSRLNERDITPDVVRVG